MSINLRSLLNLTNKNMDIGLIYNRKASKRKVKQENGVKTEQENENEENNNLVSSYFKPKKLNKSSDSSASTSLLLDKSKENFIACKEEKLDLNSNNLDEQNLNENLDTSDSKKAKWEPPQWQEQYARIKEMRSNQTAPVDTMGCDALSNVDPNILPNVRRFQVLVSLMLSSQTKDEVTAKAMVKLQTLPLDVEKILETDEEVIEKLIYPVSFYKRKAQYIKKTAQILKDKYENDIPKTINELCKLPGVGPKMGYLAMQSAWNQSVGIGVDTHVHRISNRLGWTKKETKTPEHTRKELEDWLPQSYWVEVNHMLVGFGQQTCRPVGPKCDICLCKDICPTGKTYVVKKSSKSSLKISLDDE